ncbi:MAG TPA: hypothetical protein VHO25_12430 [Polyangiaceae bacterium]|nr:hypothetical protein [Polyangiaceae bacterium]
MSIGQLCSQPRVKRAALLVVVAASLGACGSDEGQQAQNCSDTDVPLYVVGADSGVAGTTQLAIQTVAAAGRSCITAPSGAP